MKISWILEKDVFGDGHSRLARAAETAGHDVVWWSDMWLTGVGAPGLKDTFAVFHGSLGCASRVQEELGWNPGAFCSTPNFYCSAWYNAAQPWLVHDKWIQTTARDLVDNPTFVLKDLNVENEFFVRPDSPLKPFSGRTLSIDKV